MDVVSLKELLAEGDKIEAALARSAKFTPAQVASELREFAEWLVDERIRSVLEIGVHQGGTTVLFLELGCTVLSIDLPNGPGGGLREHECDERDAQILAAYPERWLGCVHGDSHDGLIRESVWRRLDYLDESVVDLLFIDGDHTLAGVQADYEDYRGCVRPGGWIVFHDITPCRSGYGVPAFWASLTGEKTTIVDPAAGWGGFGMLHV